MTGRGSQGRESEETIVDRSTDLASGVSVSVVHWRRSLLLSFSTCYLCILGLEAAKNCILAPTSHQRTTSEKRTKALLPKSPLFGGSTVYEDFSTTLKNLASGKKSIEQLCPVNVSISCYFCILCVYYSMLYLRNLLLILPHVHGACPTHQLDMTLHAEFPIHFH